MSEAKRLDSPAKGLVSRFTNARVLIGGKIINEDLWVQDGRILDAQKRFWEAAHLKEFAADIVYDCKGKILAPGFIDLQLNGGWGIDFSTVGDNGPSAQNVDLVSKRILAFGVTSYCATIITSSPEAYRSLLPALYPRSTPKHACVLGVHAEGPFISDHKYGAHPLALVRSPTDGASEIEKVYGSTDNIRIVTIAPELPGSLAVIRELARRGIIVSSGHSAATLKQAEEGARAGARMITHLYNAMQPFHHRDPGLIGMITSTEFPVHYGIIADGIHSDAASIRMAHAANPEGLVLVTDANQALGLPPGQYKLGQSNVTISNGRATVTGTDTIAGSIADLITSIRNLKRYTDCSLPQALDAASKHAAQAFGIYPTKGSLGVGSDADIVMLSDDLNVEAVFVGGELSYQSALDVLTVTTHTNPSPRPSPSPVPSPSPPPRDLMFGMPVPTRQVRLLPFLHSTHKYK